VIVDVETDDPRRVGGGTAVVGPEGKAGRDRVGAGIEPVPIRDLHLLFGHGRAAALAADGGHPGVRGDRPAAGRRDVQKLAVQAQLHVGSFQQLRNVPEKIPAEAHLLRAPRTAGQHVVAAQLKLEETALPVQAFADDGRAAVELFRVDPDVLQRPDIVLRGERRTARPEAGESDREDGKNDRSDQEIEGAAR
jgi:hypothetical protein